MRGVIDRPHSPYPDGVPRAAYQHMPVFARAVTTTADANAGPACERRTVFLAAIDRSGRGVRDREAFGQELPRPGAIRNNAARCFVAWTTAASISRTASPFSASSSWPGRLRR